MEVYRYLKIAPAALCLEVRIFKKPYQMQGCDCFSYFVVNFQPEVRIY